MDVPIIVTKSEDFGVTIIKMYQRLLVNGCEKVIAKQFLRCGTSIGANVAEAQDAQSASDFIAKLYISLKEANETIYWLKMLYRTDYIKDEEFRQLNLAVRELKAILTAIIKSKKNNMMKPTKKI